MNFPEPVYLTHEEIIKRSPKMQALYDAYAEQKVTDFIDFAYDHYTQIAYFKYCPKKNDAEREEYAFLISNLALTVAMKAFNIDMEPKDLKIISTELCFITKDAYFELLEGGK